MFKLGLADTTQRMLFDQHVGSFQRELHERKSELPTLSAVFRIKNAESNLENAVYSIAPICSEIIIVDNASTDNTLEIARKIEQSLQNICSVKIFSYNQKLAIAGENYAESLTEENSLAAYYTFAFSKASSDYVMKADAHLIYTPLALKKIQAHLKKGRRQIIFKGVELYGMKLSYERYVFKNDGSFRFVDGQYYEELKFDFTISKFEQFMCTIMTPCFLHLKRVRYIKDVGQKNLVEKIYN